MLHGLQSEAGVSEEVRAAWPARPSLPPHPLIFPLQHFELSEQVKGFIAQWIVDRWVIEAASLLRGASKFPIPTNFTYPCLPQSPWTCKR